MIIQKFLFYFLLFSVMILGIKLTQAVRDDFFFPNERLKELMKIINGKVVILFYVFIYTFLIIGGAYFIISSAPCIMNKDFAIQSGEIKSVTLDEKNNIGEKYDIVLAVGNGKYNQVDNVFSDGLKEGNEVEIGKSPRGFMGRMTKTINGKITECYKQIVKSSNVEKGVVGLLIIFNIILQVRFWKREEKSMSSCKGQLLTLQFWKKGVWLYSIIMTISLFDLINNKVIGIMGAILFSIYTFSALVFLMLEGKYAQSKA